ncbi:MAG TPA: TonB family protein [Bacteroidia bacterium]|nr:TonB family protein [Bacteroidia bacterium]
MKYLVAILFVLNAFFLEGKVDSIKFVKLNVNYPSVAKENGYTGKSLVGFWVDTNGAVSEVKILVSSDYAILDSEAVNTVKRIPKWASSKHKKEYYRTSIDFILEPRTNFEQYAYEKKWKSKYANYYYNEGVKCSQENKYQEAINYFNETLKINYKDIDALYNKGVMLFQLNKKDSACFEWYEIKYLGKTDANDLISKHCSEFPPPPSDSLEKYTVVEKMPEFMGGPTEMIKFLQNHLTYPSIEKKNKIMGKSFVKFIVERDGSISNAEIIKSSGNENLDKEAIRVVSIMPNWKPGYQNGKSVRVYFNLPILFRTN